MLDSVEAVAKDAVEAVVEDDVEAWGLVLDIDSFLAFRDDFIKVFSLFMQSTRNNPDVMYSSF